MSQEDIRIRGFDLDLPYESNKSAWNEYLSSLDPQTACRLCGIDHFPCWLASAANFKLLTDYLGTRYPDMGVREALVSALRERAPDPHSENAGWWKAMQNVVADLERFAYLSATGQVKPRSQALMDETRWDLPRSKVHAQ